MVRKQRTCHNCERYKQNCANLVWKLCVILMESILGKVCKVVPNHVNATVIGMETLIDDCDWPKQFQEIKKIDSLLRCSICFEYFNIAVVVPACSHNYCSYCIRKHISYKKHCPTCFIPLLDTDLKCNRVLDELVLYFQVVRKKLLDILEKYYNVTSHSECPINLSEYCQDVKTESDEFEPVPNFRMTATPSNQKKSSKHSKKLKETVKSNDLNKCFASQSTTTRNSDNADDMACCPVCNEPIPIKRVNIHLDGCLKAKERSLKYENMKTKESETNAEDDEMIDFTSSRDIEIADKNENGTKKIEKMKIVKQENVAKIETSNDLILSSATILMKPLAKVCFDSLSDKQLRNKAKSFGLYTKGDRKALTQRINHYILLYNSQCDSSHPLSAQEIAMQVLKEEKQLETHGYKANVLPQTFDLRYSEERKQEFALNHSNHYNKEFMNHIEKIKSRKKLLATASLHKKLLPLNQSITEGKSDLPIKTNQLIMHNSFDVNNEHKSFNSLKTEKNKDAKYESSFCEGRINEEPVFNQLINQEPSKNNNNNIVNTTIISLDKNCLNSSFKSACSPEKLQKNYIIKSPLFSSSFESDIKIKDHSETDNRFHQLSPVCENIQEIEHTSETETSFNQLLSVNKNMQMGRKQLAKKSSVNSKRGLKRSSDSESSASNKKAKKINFDLNVSDNRFIKIEGGLQHQSIIEISDSDSDEPLFQISGLTNEISLLVDEAVMNPYNSTIISKDDDSSDSCLVPDVPTDFELFSSFKF
ncbi:E3 ubiquitin-protein ligase RAD18 isoform X3 [Hydra vulgaris]|uniref:RING-type E3 ubiquitin transferase n=1 Tax=Hydra vulgaris TaxID=6087 RepID=A0ABM4DGJ8_HYDVU